MEFITIPALSLKQSLNKEIYVFGINGKNIHQFAGVKHASRDNSKNLIGYQRLEIRRHILEIKEYIETESPRIPNAVVIAFDNRVIFEKQNPSNGDISFGLLKIPIIKSDQGTLPGWIVDGQQRLAAIRDARVDKFNIFVTSFIADDESEAREHFVLVNNTKPLSKSLINELLPHVQINTSSQMHRKKIPAYLTEMLNNNKKSPLESKIGTSTNPQGIIKDNSMHKFINRSLSDGVLAQVDIREIRPQSYEIMFNILCDYWSAVRETWSDIWDLGPKESRLFHGVGIASLGLLMDSMSSFLENYPDKNYFNKNLNIIKPYCFWNNGEWTLKDGTKIKWNQFQNTSQDLRRLSASLQYYYIKNKALDDFRGHS
jgi:DNA sulfur modification protein DndB